MIPQSGIDVIRLTLFPFFFNHLTFRDKKHVNPHNTITIHKAGMFYTLEIHIEYFDLMEDFYTVIARAIYDLIYGDFIFFPLYDGVIDFIKNNINWFVLCIHEVEFYFNLLRKSVIVNEDAVERNELIQFKENGIGQYSYYSNDYRAAERRNKKTGKISRNIKRHSLIHLYDKKAKNLKDNHINHEELEKDKHEIRLEFKLFRDNCKFLSLENFNGNFYKILSRFNPLLAIIYNQKVLGKIQIKGKKNKELANVIRISKTIGTRYTNRNKILSPTSAIPEHVRRNNRVMIKQDILEQGYNDNETPSIIKDHIKNMI